MQLIYLLTLLLLQLRNLKLTFTHHQFYLNEYVFKFYLNKYVFKFYML